MSHILDLRNSGGELVLLGKALVLPSSMNDEVVPLTGSLRYNPGQVRIEAYIGGSWKSVINEGGAVIAHTHSMADISGLTAALAAKANSVHAHTIAQVTGLQAALDAKANTNHTHVITIADVVSLPDELASLSTRINAKADIGHTHPPEVKYESIQACFPNRPYSSATLLWTAGFDCTFAANFTGSYGNLVTNPTDPFAIAIWRGASQVGTISVSTSGVFTFATTNGQSLAMTKGQALRFVAPATADPTIRTVSFTMVATRT